MPQQEVHHAEIEHASAANSTSNAQSSTGIVGGNPSLMETQNLSKNAQKRLAKIQRYEADRPDRLKRKKAQRLAKRAAVKASINAGERQKPKRHLEPQVPSSLRILIDCSFDDLMMDREIKSMCSQLTRCHAENRVARHPCQVFITGWGSKIAERFTTVFSDQQKQWSRVRIFAENYLTETEGHGTSSIEGLDKEDMIYLSADSEDTIQEIDESKIYIIGGLVDKNRYKNLCQEKAVRQGIRTGKLPIGEHIKMSSRKVLTVNHVFEIMSRWLEMRDWEKAFLAVIPKRKLPNAPDQSTATSHVPENEDNIDDDDDDDSHEDIKADEEAREQQEG